jgi:hypothetical protein
LPLAQQSHAFAQEFSLNHCASIILAFQTEQRYSNGTSEAARSLTYERPLDQHLRKQVSAQ